VPQDRPEDTSAPRAAAAADEISCVIADDHPAIAELLTRYLQEHGIVVVGRATNGRHALDLIEAEQPRVALLDARMPGLSGIDIARSLAGDSPTGIVIYTGHADSALLVDALDAGARGFVQKGAELNDVLRAIRAVAAGGTYVDPLLSAALVSAGLDGKLPALTPRERDVLRLLADGLSNDEVGERLTISPYTVRALLRRAMAKLDADTRTGAVATALRQSLID
jgi:DNA-binding NarL/FixJ family response regulator